MKHDGCCTGSNDDDVVELSMHAVRLNPAEMVADQQHGE
jgi:hypothetical protein